MLFHDEESTLFCMHCQKETPHKITYVNDTISSIECLDCHNTMSIDIDVLEEFHHHLYERIVSKPGRMSEEAREDLNKFLATLPMRIISKPLRFGNEYTHLNKEVKQFIQHQKSQEDEEER